MTPDELEARRSYLGASDVGAVVGVDPFKTALDVFASKLGLSKPTDSVATRLGNLFEGPILFEYARMEGVELAFPATIRGAEPWIAATPDAVVVAPERLVECKVVGYRMAHRWGAEDDGVEGVPIYVLTQVQWAMGVGGWAEADVIALLGTELRRYRVPRDDEMIAMLVDACRQFWFAHVSTGLLPEVTGDSRAREVIAARYPTVERGILPAPVGVPELAAQYRAALDALTAAETEKKRLGNLLRLQIGDALGFEGSWGRVTLKPKKGSPIWKAIATELDPTPDLIARHTSAGSRVLNVSLNGE
jgi:putative phage-type endonuclease